LRIPKTQTQTHFSFALLPSFIIYVIRATGKEKAARNLTTFAADSVPSFRPVLKQKIKHCGFYFLFSGIPFFFQGTLRRGIPFLGGRMAGRRADSVFGRTDSHF